MYQRATPTNFAKVTPKVEFEAKIRARQIATKHFNESIHYGGEDLQHLALHLAQIEIKLYTTVAMRPTDEKIYNLEEYLRWGLTFSLKFIEQYEARQAELAQ